jgi:hypothetical protein
MTDEEYSQKYKELKHNQLIETGKLAEEYLKSKGVLDSLGRALPINDYSFIMLDVDELQTLRNATQDYIKVLDEVIYAKRIGKL